MTSKKEKYEESRSISGQKGDERNNQRDETCGDPKDDERDEQRADQKDEEKGEEKDDQEGDSKGDHKGKQQDECQKRLLSEPTLLRADRETNAADNQNGTPRSHFNRGTLSPSSLSSPPTSVSLAPSRSSSSSSSSLPPKRGLSLGVISLKPPAKEDGEGRGARFEFVPNDQLESHDGDVASPWKRTTGLESATMTAMRPMTTVTTTTTTSTSMKMPTTITKTTTITPPRRVGDNEATTGVDKTKRKLALPTIAQVETESRISGLLPRTTTTTMTTTTTTTTIEREGMKVVTAATTTMTTMTAMTTTTMTASMEVVRLKWLREGSTSHLHAISTLESDVRAGLGEYSPLFRFTHGWKA